MRFNINNYKGKYVMHCDTEEKADIFLCYLDSIGKRWLSRDSYLKYNDFKHYGKYTAYIVFNKGQYCNVEHFKNNGYKVLEFDDFDWSDDYEDDISDSDILSFIGGNYEI